MLETARELLHRIYDVQGIIEWGGLAMICGIVFAETGLMVGFFLPGDSLLVTAGVFAAAGHLRLIPLLLLGALCAIVGDQVGYLTGRKIGKALYSRKDSFFFRRKHVERAHDFYERYGAKTIVIARFVPIVRTFAPIVAGVAEMRYRTFVVYNVVGGLLWVWGLALGGYFLGRLIPDIDEHIHVVIVVVVALSLLPMAIEFLKARRRSRQQA